VTGERSLDEFAEARSQVILADRIVLSKADLADAATVERLSGHLRALNPRAEIVAAQNGELEPHHLTDTAPATDRQFLAEAAHSDGIQSFVLNEHSPLAWDTFSRFMETLIALRGADLLRVKGLLNIAGCRGPVVVQFVQHLAHPPTELTAWPDEDRRSRAVFIARGLNEDAVRSLFDSIRALSTPSS
jgi:G3E family GTPase